MSFNRTLTAWTVYHFMQIELRNVLFVPVVTAISSVLNKFVYQDEHKYFTMWLLFLNVSNFSVRPNKIGIQVIRRPNNLYSFYNSINNIFILIITALHKCTKFHIIMQWWNLLISRPLSNLNITKSILNDMRKTGGLKCSTSINLIGKTLTTFQTEREGQIINSQLANYLSAAWTHQLFVICPWISWYRS